MIYICENILDFDIEMALRAVSAERRERSLRYRFERDRRQSIAAYLLLKHGLMQEYGIDTAPDFSYSNGGKPHISTHLNIHFNMSHCQQGVACAISRYPIGIDIEAITEIDWDVARHVMNNEQLHTIASSPNPQRSFCELWTTKESILKQTGEGLCDNLPQLAIDKYSFTRHHGKDYVCTACYSHPEQHEEFRLVTL